MAFCEDGQQLSLTQLTIILVEIAEKGVFGVSYLIHSECHSALNLINMYGLTGKTAQARYQQRLQRFVLAKTDRKQHYHVVKQLITKRLRMRKLYSKIAVAFFTGFGKITLFSEVQLDA